MHLRLSSLAVAGVLIASGGALAAAHTAGPGSTAATTAETTATASAEAVAGASATPGADDAETRTPPGLAKKEADGTRGPAARGAASEDSGPGLGRGHGRGPDATGPAAYGLCQAWAEQEDPAAKAERVPPFRNLAAAAGGVDRVEAYCAALLERPADEDD